jgi:hypothetical protein
MYNRSVPANNSVILFIDFEFSSYITTVVVVYIKWRAESYQKGGIKKHTVLHKITALYACSRNIRVFLRIVEHKWQFSKILSY